ncbi:ABC transporter substrate-binding protein [Rubellimicrobium sp. CFH 75288]|uniref:ABC transporter substrate-binding protein n=1 Tax=Rubellimicrobium sp. CFH 75288 TaxID=2697034 RepID=UPI001412A809|nr:ABC transporter substrate-binding protein [Rubellimicrobium sp. CFH 75288]NAZ38283.1 ABC transporter substrate-binding protein [Rubellimicrobium sp. CFH 75288]
MRAFLTSLVLAASVAPAVALDCPDGTRTVLHPLIEGGGACVPVGARIAWVEAAAVNAWLLGAPSVTWNIYLDQFRAAYPGAFSEADRAGAVDIGRLPEADFEAIAAAAPDLFVSGDFWPEENARLDRIAPVVVIDYEGQAPGWREIHTVVAAILGKEAAADEQLAAFDARLADLRARLGPDPGSFAIARMMDSGGQIQVFTEMNFGAQQMLAAGFAMHEGVLSPDEAAALNRPYWYALSTERLGDLAADWLVVLPGWDAAVEEALKASPLWQSLPPVAAGRLIAPAGEGQHWIRDNVAFAHLVLDEIYDRILGLAPPPVPNPFGGWLAGN